MLTLPPWRANHSKSESSAKELYVHPEGIGEDVYGA